MSEYESHAYNFNTMNDVLYICKRVIVVYSDLKCEDSISILKVFLQ